MKKYLLLIHVLVLAMISGCATVPTADIRVEAEADQKIKFSGYNTYAWLGAAAIKYDPKGRWEPLHFDADAEIKYLIDREMRERGMVRTTVNPDMLVVYAAGINMEALKLQENPETKIKMLKAVPQGSLMIILVDTKTQYVIWAGRALADIQKDPDTETVKKRLDYAVKKMMEKLPK